MIVGNMPSCEPAYELFPPDRTVLQRTNIQRTAQKFLASNGFTSCDWRGSCHVKAYRHWRADPATARSGRHDITHSLTSPHLHYYFVQPSARNTAHFLTLPVHGVSHFQHHGTHHLCALYHRVTAAPTASATLAPSVST